MECLQSSVEMPRLISMNVALIESKAVANRANKARMSQWAAGGCNVEIHPSGALYLVPTLEHRHPLGCAQYEREVIARNKRVEIKIE